MGFGKSAGRVFGAPGGPERREWLRLVRSCLTSSPLEMLPVISPMKRRASRPESAFLEGFGGKGDRGVPAGARAVLGRLQAPRHPRFRTKSWAHALLGCSSCVSAKRLLTYQARVEAPGAEQRL